jgi:hypothetical protein
MRLALLLGLTACWSSSKKPQEPQPPIARPSADPAREDLAVFCGPDATAKAASVPKLGAYLEDKLQEGPVKAVLDDLKNGRLEVTMLRPRIEELMAKAGVATCPTLDLLTAKR